MKAGLVRALCSCVGGVHRARARRFLQGLSADELQYIAEFFGSCILESHHRMACERWQLAEEIAEFERCRRAATLERKRCAPPPASLEDEDHKMILLLEYLCRCDQQQFSLARAGRA